MKYYYLKIQSKYNNLLSKEHLFKTKEELKGALEYLKLPMNNSIEIVKTSIVSINFLANIEFPKK